MSSAPITQTTVGHVSDLAGLIPYVLLLVAVASVVGLVLQPSLLFGALGIVSALAAMLFPVSHDSSSV
jgi:hypothetical protein